MSFSINTNIGAQVALQNLNSTNKELNTVQNRINTGLRVASAKDNAAAFSIAQGQRADISGIAAVQQNIARAESVLSVAQTAGTKVSDLLVKARDVAIAASNTTLSAGDRASLSADFVSIRDQIDQVVNGAAFDGINVLDGSLTSGLSVNTNSDGTGGTVSLASIDLNVGGTIVTFGTVGSTDVDASADPFSASASNAVGTGSRALLATADLGDAGFADGDQLVIETTDADGAVQTTLTINFVSGATVDTDATDGVIELDIDAGTNTIQDLIDAVNTGSGGLGGADVAASLDADGNFVLTADNADEIIDVDGDSNALTSLGYTVGGQSFDPIDGGAAVASAVVANIDTALTAVNSQLGTIARAQNTLETQNSFLDALSSALTAELGNLVDADLAEESAKLQSLQVKQQLGIQALGIANSAPNNILALFR